jgi:hypothetical protein
MNLRKNITTALLIAIGYIMHQVMPGTIGGMKFDFMLPFIFVALLLDSSFKGTILTALLGGAITALTTSFPGGQIPNIVDKLVTSIVVYLMIKAAGKLKGKSITIGIMTFIGTMVSGTVFLYTALLLAGLPAPFMVLFTGIVIPTAITNIFVTLLVYNAAKVASKATGNNFV